MLPALTEYVVTASAIALRDMVLGDTRPAPKRTRPVSSSGNPDLTQRCVTKYPIHSVCVVSKVYKTVSKSVVYTVYSALKCIILHT